MSKIVGIGACVMDTLVTVPQYPAEDTKLCATASKQAGGGPVATGLVAAAKLGESSCFIGALADDAGGRFLMDDFQKYGMSTELITVQAGYRSFASTIWLSEATASRTCVFDRGNVPPLTLTDTQKQAIADAALLMVDGNELEAAIEAAKWARQNGVRVLYDAGGQYPGVERLLPWVDILIPSEEFALGHTGCQTAEQAAVALYNTYHPQVVVITQGKRGGVRYDGTAVQAYPAFPVQAVDSNGAGDVFHGAFAAGVVKGYSYEVCCWFASAVSAIKCTGVGARESVPNMATVTAFLKEKGYEL